MQVPREGLEQKLQRLSQSQQSIESVSSFCIFYHKDARGVVGIWETEFYKAPAERKLALLFLANHILQEGRKKGMAFQEEFFKVLPKAVGHISKHGDDKARRSINRMVNVWEERRVFGTRHIKSFKDLLGGGAAADGAAKAASVTAGSAAGAGAGSGGAAVAVSRLGPVGEALTLVLQQAAAAAAKGQEFTNSWSQGVLTTGGLPEVTAAHSKLKAYAAALQQEVAGRKAALTALSAETARQNAELTRAEAQLQMVGSQSADLEARLATLTSQMTSAMASLGQLFQQNGGGTAAATAPVAAAPPTAEDGGGSPQAPDMELEEDDDGRDGLSHSPAPAAAVPTVLPGGLDPNLLSMIQQQQQQQPPPADLQALLHNPAMLSAAITGATGIAPTGPGAAATLIGFPAVGGQQLGLGTEGMQLQLPSTRPAPAAAGYVAAYSANLALGGSGGAAAAQDGGGFGGLMGLEQQQSGFADEGEDPYDPEHPD